MWCENLNLTNIAQNTVNKTWKPLYGERSTIVDNYNELVIDFDKSFDKSAVTESGGYDCRRNYKMSLIVRAYNEGVVFRYFISENTNGLFMHITGEQTQFTMHEGTRLLRALGTGAILSASFKRLDR